MGHSLFQQALTTQTISLSLVDDNLPETNETIVITLANPSNGASLGANNTHTFTIIDDDSPNVSFASATSSGSENVTTVTIPVNLSISSPLTITVDYAVTGGTATGGGVDYTLASGTLTFNPGDLTKNITFTVVNDTLYENDETVQITLSNQTNSNLGLTTTHTYTIQNDDSMPQVAFSISNSNGLESVTTVNIAVVLNTASGLPVTVDYSATGGTATGGGVDYTLNSGTLTFAPGETSKNITLSVVNDTLDEDDETVQVTISSPTNATLGTNTVHTYTINDDDSPPTVEFATASSSGNENSSPAVFTVSLSSASGKTITVDYSVNGITATNGGVDFNLSAGTLTFAPGQTTKTISATIVNDSLNEANETFSMTLNNPSNVTLGTNQTHTYTILDDDPQPTIQFASASSSTPDESATNRTVQITLSAVSGQDVSVTVSMTGGSATPGTDFTNPFPVTATITAGNTSTTVTIPILADLIVEGNETINLQLSSPTNATLGGFVNHTFTITDDDVGIVSAETLDTNGDGQIDHYKITFTEAVNDSSFPGYVANSLGNSQTDWLVAGYSGVVLAHGTAAPETDTVNDAIIYLKFTQSGSADTDAKPDLTTTTSPTLVTVSSKTVGIVYTASVTEADRAKPVIISATTNTATNVLTVTFSEPVWGSAGMPACGSGGQLTVSGFTYNNVSGSGVSSLTGMGSDTCGTDEVVTLTANTNFTAGDHNTDTLALTSNVYDGANNTGNTTAKAVSVVQGPEVTNVQLFDIDKNGKIDQIKLTFTLPMNDSSFNDSDAAQFTYAGSPLVKVDTVSGGTGTISPPNNDPGVANDNIVTVFTNNSTVSGTDLKTLAFTFASGKWKGNNGVEMLSYTSLLSVTEDKAPPVIISAVAADNTNSIVGVDSDDTLVITFSEPTNKPNIHTGNISSIFSLSAGHTWGNITSAVWNTAGDELTITFAGSGSTVAVGDYITILGTITDTASSPNTSVNIPSVVPITGDFYIDNVPPTLTSNFSVTPTTIRIVYSEPVNATEATTISNYKVVDTTALTGTCSSNTNFTSSPATSDFSISSITQVNSTTFDLVVSANQVADKQYTLVVNKPNVHDLAASPNAMGCPNSGNFIGQEKLKVVSVQCVNRYSFIVTFSKPFKTGVNAVGSAECNNTTECNKRYKTTGVSSLGDIQSAFKLDGTVCNNAPADNTKVCVTHDSNPIYLQKGGVYTVIGANNLDGDNFNNAGIFGIRDTADVEYLQSSPKDRASFNGCYATPDYLSDGPIINDPFGDGSTFGYLADFNSQVYIGPNMKGNSAARFGYTGSNPQTLGFSFAIDNNTSGGGTKLNTHSGPFYSIGHSGCTPNVNTIDIACGPDNENGRGIFSTGTLGGTKYLFLAGARTTDDGSGNYHFDYIYYTSDTSTTLNFKYIDMGTITGTVTAGTSALVTFNDRLYGGFGKVSTGTSNVPDFGRINFAPTTGEGTECTAGNNCDATDGSGGRRIRIDRMPHFGGNNGTNNQNYARIVGVDSLFVFNNRLYAANGGYPQVNRDGGIIRSNNALPAPCSASNTCPDWTEIAPRSNPLWYNSPTNNRFSLELSKFYDLIPADRAFPQFAEFNGRLYVTRNVCITTNGTLTGVATSVSTTPRCLDGTDTNRRAQLWKCDPTNGGADTTNPTTCESNEWSLVANNGSGFTDFETSTNRIMTMAVTNGDRLYIGFDNSTGARIYRTKTGVTNPTSESDFEQVGTAGFDGDTTNIKQIFSAISVNSSGDYYLYISAGNNGIPVKAYRHKN